MIKILVLGGNFGGVTSALEARRRLKGLAQVKVSLFPPRKFAMMLPSSFGDFVKVLIEKLLLLKYRMGWSWLP